ncbi:cytidyltransferase [Clostridiisalibacter paucivorans]|uniref:cytidyltransferase n=1 Tax=Clostridiisalibacter paucivorans TaxID=408753 RepID=UPI00047C98DB|nr:cytidyltransferase [Clostridiisalibacter paucivorans]
MLDSMALMLYTDISNRLQNSEIKSKSVNDFNKIRKFIQLPAFIKGLEDIISNQSFDCKSIEKLCSPILSDLSKGQEPNNWLYYIYQFTLNKSFPNAVEITLEKELEIPSVVYLKVLRSIMYFREKHFKNTLKFPLQSLTREEEKELKDPEEYLKFKDIFLDNYIHEMMQLSQEVTGHNTLDHISGVHYLAMFISRQLKKLGQPIDLGRISGAAAGHDIGKYGCKPSESQRVPYLHYYYTDIWFKKYDITYIGHIATNHSTWDLELENLSLESLVLIYSDFRVKNKLTGHKPEMHIYSLTDSFQIILDKLDNVDEKKEKRYKKVYSKLKDFENYMIDLGINVSLDKPILLSNKRKHFALMKDQDVIENIKYLSIDHNINLMYKLRDESSLGLILETARSENDWKNLRGYLETFKEYSTYLAQKQKLITLNFLYELLIHPEDDIRKQSAELIGSLIATFDEEYRKEVPNDVKLDPPSITSCELLDEYIHLFLHPDHKIIEVHKEWIGYSLEIMVSSLFKHCNTELKSSYNNILMKYYKQSKYEDDEIKFYLLQTIKHIPINRFNNGDLEPLFNFIMGIFRSDNIELRLSNLENIYNILFRLQNKSKFVLGLKETLSTEPQKSENPAENFLTYKIAKKLELNSNTLNLYSSYYKYDMDKVSDIFLKNLKTATSWVNKKIHIEMLLERVIYSPEEYGLHTAMHFCNLIKVSAKENVRRHAGEALLKIFPFLSIDEKNDVTVELLRALEIQGYHFTKYIPNYLGQIMLYLHPVELNEILDDFIEKIKESNTQIKLLLLKTIGVSIKNYPKYRMFFQESEDISKNRLIKMIGILLNGIVSYDLQVKKEAFSVIGRDIFGCRELTLEEKNMIFTLIAKKLLILLSEKDESELLFLSNSSSLNHIYRFISDYVFFNGSLSLNHNKKIAFFPGTFDPFSLSHKEIAHEIKNLGFEVYLSVDEFSWSKRTQPHLLRRKIINMSIADELDIYLYPEDIPINITNPMDLKNLVNAFDDDNIYIVVGSDVVLNASSYKTKPQNKYSIHSFNHIIFKRKSAFSSEDDDTKIDESLKRISGDIIELSLPPQYEDISSTQIRNYIDENRDISQLIDPLAQNYIYSNGLYRREPQYKTLVQTKSLEIQIIDHIDHNIIKKLCHMFFSNNDNALYKLKKLKDNLNSRFILVRDISNDNKIIGFSAFHWARSTSLYHEFKNNNISEYIRENSIGRISLIDGIFVDDNSGFENLRQILLTETLAYSISKDYTYGIFKDILDNHNDKKIQELLLLHGFKKLEYSDKKSPVFVVNMTNPCTLNLDLENIIKNPFSQNPYIKESIIKTRKKLQLALSKLYPGHLLISFDRDILYDNLIDKICKINGMPSKQLEPRHLGPYTCTPFGSILNGCIIPNTVTKSMHTEKLFNSNIKDFTIGPFPHYMNLENQMKMIKSFNRPVILVDDLLNKGYRIKVLDPLLKNANIDVKKIIVGILSGRGKEIMDIQDREVDSAYFIPNLRVWFNESSMYPFIGGDSVWRGFYPERNLIPSINFILPYVAPKFIKNTTNKSIYDLSEICLNNSIELLTIIEEEYQNMNEKSFTLKHLSELFISPRCPDHGKSIDYDINLKPSQYLYNDLEHLKRLENIIKR